MPRQPVMPKALAKYSQGESFCARDFGGVTNATNAKNLLAHYAGDGLLERLLPGVYCLTPEGAEAFRVGDERPARTMANDGGIGRGADDEADSLATVVHPPAEDVARTLARLRGWVIAPTGEMALAALGIIPAATGELTYASTGSSLHYDYLGVTITFIHRSTRELVGLGETTRLVMQAFRTVRKPRAAKGPSVGAEPIPPPRGVSDSIARTFSEHQMDELRNDAPRLPQWMQAEIRRIAKLHEEAIRTAQSRRTIADTNFELDPSLLDSATSAFRSALANARRAPLETGGHP